MSFPLAWAPFDNDETSQNTDIEKKKSTKNKTLKKHTKPNVAAIIDKIHANSSDGSNGTEEGMADFTPPPMPKSAGEERIGTRKQGEHQDNDNSQAHHLNLGGLTGSGVLTGSGGRDEEHGSNVSASTEMVGDGALTPESFGDIKSTQVEDYYRKNVPYFTQMSEQPITNRNELMKKMDKILYLLEEQQDHKTGHATEELILYSFVGVFLIFIVDSFARAGKYVR
tara:strand:+ start:264 stop:938 length:675 start_codon:yes stop_codon:yes gene_type:complete